MNRRDFLGAIGGSFSLSMACPFPGAIAQDRSTIRTVHETTAERLLQVYSYVPHTPKYEALALDDALWSDISKEFDAFGYRDSRADYFEEREQFYLNWLTVGNSPSWAHFEEPARYDFVPTLSADQIFQLGVFDPPTTLTLYTGIDPAIPTAKFEERDFSVSPIVGGALFTHPDMDVRWDITWNRFAILLDEGVLVWFETQELAEEYAAWRDAGGFSLADSVILHEKLRFAGFDAVTYAWADGSRVNLNGSIRRVLGEYAAAETIEAYRDQMMQTFEQQERLIGKMPRIQSVIIGADAGAYPVPELLMTGYDAPEAYIRLQLDSESEAYLAAAIITWRMENSPSFISREFIDFEPFDPLPFDFGEATEGILVQRFGNPLAAHRVLHMLQQYDPAIYGWGELS